MSRMRKRILQFVLLAVAFLFALLAAALVFPKFFLCIDSGPAKADVIIVLGGNALDRPEHAAELFKEHAAPEIIVSGAGDDEIDRQILIKAGVPRNVIFMESNSRNTSENAQFSIRLLRQEKLNNAIIVTSWYHSRRALKCFEHFAPDIRFLSCPSYFESAHWEWMHDRTFIRVCLEYPKLVEYWVRYGICPF